MSEVPVAVPMQVPRDSIDGTRQQRVELGGALARLFTLRIRYLSRFQRATPTVIEGDCLRPYVMPGDVLWWEATPPQDGDLAMVRMRYQRRTGIIGAGSVRVTERQACKQYRVIDGVEMLCSADGSVRASGHEILGTVCAWYRPAWWRRPAVRNMRFAPSATP